VKEEIVITLSICRDDPHKITVHCLKMLQPMVCEALRPYKAKLLRILEDMKSVPEPEAQEKPRRNIVL